MCGICGKYFLTDDSKQVSRESLQGMMKMLEHRGPDEEGMYFYKNVGLGHKRLRIIDLKSGAQPMANEDETVWVIYNGEIYNYKELRSFLISRGHALRTTSDTEVIVHLYEEFGEAFVPKLQGMFSFALWDQKTKVLMLARDRVGIKPLYYCLTKEALLFGSEIKSILSDLTVPTDIDLSAIDSFLTFSYLPGEQTLFKYIRKLRPGHYLTVRNGNVKISQYWDLEFSGAREHQHIDDSVAELDCLLGKTIRNHMISEVPVGVLLSGGVDSTAVLSYATESASTLSTFTIGFGEHCSMDERLSARVAASRFGTKHYEATFTAQDFAECIPKYVWHMEEPVCEPPAIALYYITKVAREHATVLLSGEGSDEAFAGYKNYRNIVWLERLKTAFGPLTGPLAQICGTFAKTGGFRQLRRYADLLSLPLEKYYFSRVSGELDLLNCNRRALYAPQFQEQVQTDTNEWFSKSILANMPQSDTLQKLLYIDTKTWLPDDLLIKADKMTMANSVELRVPFLDHHVLEFAASLPARHKLHGLETKHVLKRALAARVPRETLKRRKTGFPVPYDVWLRTELKGFAWDILTDPHTLERGYFKGDIAQQLLRQNTLDGSHSKEIFSLIVLELWHRTFKEAATSWRSDLLKNTTLATLSPH
jgi:asparagine synthase (glutamine-hydrolysing)